MKSWDTATGQGRSSFETPIRDVRAVALSRDGRRLALGTEEGTVSVRDRSTGEEVFTFRRHSGPVYSLTFIPDGRRLVSASDDQLLKVWDILLTGQEALTFRGHTGRITAVAFSPDSLRLAFGSRDGTVKVWDGTPLRGDGSARLNPKQPRD